MCFDTVTNSIPDLMCFVVFRSFYVFLSFAHVDSGIICILLDLLCVVLK